MKIIKLRETSKNGMLALALRNYHREREELCALLLVASALVHRPRAVRRRTVSAQRGKAMSGIAHKNGAQLMIEQFENDLSLRQEL